VLVSKFCDSLPLYRQSQMLARQGVTLDRSTLSNWVGRACWWLTPLYDLLVSTALSVPKLFADDTTLPVLDPGRGRTKTGRIWCYAVDDRPWAGPTHPVAAYVYAEDRKGSRPAAHLAGFRGVLQVDGYDGFKRLALDRTDSSVTLAFCWAHMRRGFYDFWVSTKSPLAAWVLAKIGELYAIEAEIRGQPAEHRRRVRQERSRPIVEALHTWLQDHIGRVSAVSDLAKAMRYAIRHWPGLSVFLEDGRVEMDTNVVERAIRPNTLTRNYPYLRIMGSSPCPDRKYRDWVTLSSSHGTVHTGHNSDLLPGPFHRTGGQNGRRDHHPAATACLASAQRFSGLCNCLQRSSSSRSVCPDHPAHLPLLRCALRPLADNRAPCPGRGQRSWGRAIRGGTSAAL
jgi:hypothetical protein